ncbi:MAG: OmpA family protein [Pseudomonadota bacterium]
MRSNFVLSFMSVALISAGAVSAHAQEGFYDPSNAASPTGKTIGYELYKTIGCPGQQIFGTPCKDVPAKDSDGDGVTDDKDKCPNTPKGRKVNAEGCELDSDGDGVVDGLDKCPGTPAGRKVNADGCEIDTDGDGLVDGVDKCPAVYAKTADGCPLAAAAPSKLILEDVNFDYDKATLRADAVARLDQAAEALRQWGNTKVEVAGHTDSMGSDEYNMRLSEQRANAVRDYLVGKGIEADRLTAKGYGESQPLADNGTEEGRARNRRVELVPQQ